MDKLIFYTKILLISSVLLDINADLFFDYGGTGGLFNGKSHDSHVSSFGNERTGVERGGFGSVMDDLFASPGRGSLTDDFSSEAFLDVPTIRLSTPRPRGRPPGSGVGKPRKRGSGTGWKKIVRKKDRMTAADKKLHRETFEEFQERRIKERMANPETNPSRLLENKANKHGELPTLKPTTEKARARFHTKISSWYWSREKE